MAESQNIEYKESWRDEYLKWVCSMSEIADRLGVSYKTVQRAIADLKENSVIERFGGKKQGYWRIKEKEQADTEGKVLELITAQTDISMSEIADRLGVSYKTVQRAIADLKENSVIERIGGRKKGYWRIKDKEQMDTGGKRQ